MTHHDWPASRLNGFSPIRLLAAVTLLMLGVVLATVPAQAGTPADAPITLDRPRQ